MERYNYLVVGAGFAGVVFAERIASRLKEKVLVIEKRNHIGGNAYDYCDEDGVFLHQYGPHIFHTNEKNVYDYLSNFTSWRFYEHKVLALHREEYYPIPINRLSINKLLKKDFATELELANYLESVKSHRQPALNSEDVVLNQIGGELFETFYRHYTKKFWGMEPKDLLPEVCGRVPVRLNDDCRYFTDKYQFMPAEGYTKMFERMLNNRNIELKLDTDFEEVRGAIKYDKLIYTGPIDSYFNYKYGRLPYRSLRIVFEKAGESFCQPAAVVNLVDSDSNCLRVTDYKQLYEIVLSSSTISKEYYQPGGEPMYPVLTESSRHLYELYAAEAANLTNVIFCGRLANYWYYNMDQVVAIALRMFDRLVQ